MNIDGKELREDERLKWLADHRQDDISETIHPKLDINPPLRNFSDYRIKDSLEYPNPNILDRDDLISAIHWKFDSTSNLPTDLRTYAPEPLQDDEVSEEEAKFIDEHYAFSGRQYQIQPAPDGPMNGLGKALVVAAVVFIGFLLYVAWKWLAVHHYFYWLPNY